MLICSISDIYKAQTLALRFNLNIMTKLIVESLKAMQIEIAEGNTVEGSLCYNRNNYNQN